MADAIVREPKYTLDATQFRAIRHAVLIGLESYGEIDRLRDEYEHACLVKAPIPDGMRPIHPTGTSETIGDFATALRFLTSVEEDAHG